MDWFERDKMQNLTGATYENSIMGISYEFLLMNESNTAKSAA